MKPRKAAAVKSSGKKASQTVVAAVRSVPAAKRATRTVRALETVAPLPATSALLSQLLREEVLAVQQALSGKSVVLEGSPRARDAALFSGAAQVAKRPVLVASPLASELFEQARQVKGLDVVMLGGALTDSARATVKKRLLRGGSLLVVVEPASLFDAELRQVVSKTPLALVGIAAAHACSEHAHELSPAYLGLREALQAFGAPVLATSTRTSPRVVDQIVQAIGAGRNGIISAAPPSVTMAAQVVRASERKALLSASIQAYGAPGIVLTATSQEADAVFAELEARGIACVRAHGGMAAPERQAALARFSSASKPWVLVTQSPHANASGLAGCAETNQVLGSAAPRADLRFVIHYQAPLSLEQHFEDVAWLPRGAHSLVLADSSDAALVQAILAQQRIKPSAVEAMAQALAQAPDGRGLSSDNLALRAGTSRRSAERVLSAFADRNLIVRDNGQISRLAAAEQLASEGQLLAARFAALRAADAGRAESLEQYVTSHHASAPLAVATAAAPAAAVVAVASSAPAAPPARFRQGVTAS